MPLHSITFRDDAALQNCLRLDSAHVLPGSSGAHVARIQSALVLLDHARIGIVELRTKTYGPETTAAVLAFKRKRKIINTSYQTHEDNIVGKMTIARLDEEILAAERRNTSRVFCRTSGAIGVPARSVAPSGIVAAPGVGSPKKQNKQLRTMFQATTLADALGGLNQLPALFQRARVLMAPHGLSFADFTPRIEGSIPHDLLVNVHFNSEAFSVREKALNIKPGFADVLRVIFCPFAFENPYFGSTHGGQPVDGFPEVPKFVLINTSLTHADAGTLLHEMIHASIRGNSLPHDEDNPRNVYSTALAGRDLLTEKRATQLANRFFA